MTRYTSARIYWMAGGAGYLLAALCAWLGLEWAPAYAASALFLASSTLLALLAARPPIEVHRDRLVIGQEALAWEDLRGIERTGWNAPLVVRLLLADGRRRLLIYPGDPAACRQLLRQLQRCSRRAMLEMPAALADVVEAGTQRYPLLREEDEAEVERLYQRLKSVGHLDPKSSSDEN